MHIEQQHSLEKEEVKKRGEAIAGSLASMTIPGGVTLSDIAREWHEDRMDFSFRVSKGFLGANVKGQLLVSDSKVVLDIDVPPVLSNFINQQQIEGAIKNKMAEAVS